MSKKVDTLRVDGMSCDHCVHAVKTAVGALDGVSDVAVSLEGKTVTVEYDDARATREQIKAAIDDQGYDVVD